MRGRGLLIAALACALLAAAAASLMSQTRTGVGPSSPPRAPAGAGGHSGPPSPFVPPPVTCPCYTTEAIQAVFATCGQVLSVTCNPPAVTLTAFCSGPPVTNLGSWVQVAAANECSRTYQDLQTGEPVTETLAVTAAERDACTAILTPLCPS